MTKNLPKPWSDILLGSIASIAVFILTVVFSRWENLQLSEIGVVPRKQTLPLFGCGFGIGLLLAIAQGLLVITFSDVKLMYAPQTSTITIFLTLILYLILAFREELAFHGYALRSLTYAIGSWKAQLMIAIIFSLEHFAGGYTVTQAFLGAGIGSILFGIAALKSGGIALPVGLHAAWNFGQWSIGFKNEPGIWQTIIAKGYESKYEIVNFTFYLLVMLIAIASFYFYKRK
ncbi:CPBP family intramembrane metalloprotease [Sphingobacterium sp. SRCM116780]|uniref:CPBP family intramembrane glutamic endopeptidase n=1 Tax=Sphingobacterium sp. SRCM116780 TaxID=2907623 RepID=UPI001F458885|nr:CPBP family intramembrane glutamic endopeptidase [Sphingobacterium sp. SRCM116780]UIR57100.1 CPBP family intramembrane metalloprotease [Sphingobacterium sp. SRCM116780]